MVTRIKTEIKASWLDDCDFVFPGLLRLQSIFQNLEYKNDSLRVNMAKKISSVQDALSILRDLEIGKR